MVMKNNEENQKLANRLRTIVNAETGFRGSVDSTWNCGEDIHFSIGTVGMSAAFIVSTELKKDGSFEINCHFSNQTLSEIDMVFLMDRVNAFDRIRRKLRTAVEKAMPEPSRYAR